MKCDIKCEINIPIKVCQNLINAFDHIGDKCVSTMRIEHSADDDDHHHQHDKDNDDNDQHDNDDDDDDVYGDGDDDNSALHGRGAALRER